MEDVNDENYNKTSERNWQDMWERRKGEEGKIMAGNKKQPQTQYFKGKVCGTRRINYHTGCLLADQHARVTMPTLER